MEIDCINKESNVYSYPVVQHSSDANRTTCVHVLLYKDINERTPVFIPIFVLFMFVALICVILNIIFIFILFQLQNRPFYRLVWQLIFANLFSIIGDAGLYIYTAIEDIAQTPHDTTALMQILYIFDSIGFRVQLWITLLIALQRTIMFVLPTLAKIKRFNIILTIVIILIWILGISAAIYNVFNGCGYKASAGPISTYKFHCTNRFLRIQLLSNVLMLEVTIVPAIAFILYIIIFGEIIRKRRGINKIKKNEYMILKQAVIMFLTNTLSTVVSYSLLLSSWPSNHVDTARKLVKTCEMVVGGVTLCLVYVTSKEIRQGGNRINPLRVFKKVQVGNRISSNR